MGMNLVQYDSLNYIFIGISIIFLILGLMNSKILTPFNKIWVKFGELLGRIIAPIVMAIIYFTTYIARSIVDKLHWFGSWKQRCQY